MAHLSVFGGELSTQSSVAAPHWDSTSAPYCARVRISWSLFCLPRPGRMPGARFW